MTQVLTLAGVKEAARKAYDDGKLTAQHPDPTKRKCLYRTDDGYCCAVGAAMTDETVEALRANYHGFNDTSVSMISGWSPPAEEGAEEVPAPVVVMAEGERTDIRDLQRRHDRWCDYARCEEDPNMKSCIDNMRNMFLLAIDHPTAVPLGAPGCPSLSGDAK